MSNEKFKAIVPPKDPDNPEKNPSVPKEIGRPSNEKPIIETPKSGCFVFFSVVIIVIITIDMLDRIFGYLP